MVPPQTVRLLLTTSVRESPTKANAYCVPRLPRHRKIPPAMANPTDAPLSCTHAAIRLQREMVLDWLKQKSPLCATYLRGLDSEIWHCWA